MTDWTVTPSGGSAITFPFAPNDMIDVYPSISTQFQTDGIQSIIISEGLDIRVVTWNGSFYVKGQDKNYLDTTFVSPLKAALHGIVTVGSPTTKYNGIYILDRISVEDKAEGLLQRYTYSLVFKQGSGYVVI